MFSRKLHFGIILLTPLKCTLPYLSIHFLHHLFVFGNQNHTFKYIKHKYGT